MKYKAYPEYKDSKVEWLGDVPARWNVLRNKQILAAKSDPVGLNSADYKLLSLTLNGVIHRDIESGRGKIPENFDTYQKVSIGDLIFCLFDMDETPRTIGISSLNGMITGAYSVYFCNKRAFNKYIYYYYLHIDSFKGLRPFYTGLRKVVRPENFQNIKLALPNINEQQYIANFLDQETAKIDQLIAKQERLIELLKEKRQTAISHAVTKGLNPDVKMKDSGVDWLGEVPEHWGVMQLRRYVKHIEQGKSPECEARLADDNEWAVLKSGCVNGGVFRQNEHKALPFNIKPHTEYEVKVGDLLMSRASGSVDLIGSVAFVETCREKLLLSDKVFRIILSKDMLPEYFSIIMKSDSIRNQIKLAINGAEGLANNITKEAIKSFFTTSPPISEQVDILRFIKQRMSILEKIDAKLIQSLHLLKERRSALISAAVTGKIDVRDRKPKDNA
ncbi:restriction endonuclease subunit S [Serratia fonticola]|uniref:restriction endonuclease subunit S n=1 Tax=Serratia fonticola TaxID=47917 RepID=UPI0021770997|nr:restriction endonuclease subunit S [Serratia fonticola]CAI1794701.1 Type I restriction enzyme EcoKI specificity protein [Serratia fonticola]